MTAGTAPGHRPLLARRPRARAPREGVVPMINVVFLLLVFFMMSATLAPPPALEVEPPRTGAAQDAPETGLPELAVDAGGTVGLAIGGERLAGEAALARIEAEPPRALSIRADRRLEAAALARLLTRIGAAGVETTFLVMVVR